MGKVLNIAPVSRIEGHAKIAIHLGDDGNVQDAFLHIQTWFQWPRLFDLAHFVVLNRPGFAVSHVLTPALADVWQGRLTRDAAPLARTTHGRIYLHTVTPQAISATDIRNRIAAGADDAALLSLLPAPVLAYIRAHQLYLPEKPPLASH